jgi:murein DD-endopeptidase MepM/ murein hydrolase activator NlpD
MRWSLLGLVLLVGLAACFESSDEPAQVLADGTTLPDRDVQISDVAGAVTPAPFTPAAVISDLDPEDLRGFTFPIEGGCLPSRDEVMPNAPREYRSGFSEGVDFYDGDVCTAVERGLPVHALFTGIVIRADHDYDEITEMEASVYATRAEAQGFTDDEALDAFRGRQLWIDHGNGVVTRYASLESIAPSITVGVALRSGDVIGGVGESGTTEATTAPGTQIHLHIEVRIDDGFLGQQIDAGEVRGLYQRLFSPVED